MKRVCLATFAMSFAATWVHTGCNAECEVTPLRSGTFSLLAPTGEPSNAESTLPNLAGSVLTVDLEDGLVRLDYPDGEHFVEFHTFFHSSPSQGAGGAGGKGLGGLGGKR